jgi:NAD(P)-dependent dehydrogenase (short-subunit alcohol dehydrogenase family)
VRAAVIGASRGIGRAIREEFDGWGWSSIDLSRSSGFNAVYDDLGKMTAHDPDVLVYSAGTAAVGPLVEVHRAVWRSAMAVHFFGAVAAVQQFVKVRAGRPGVVVLIASTAGTRPSPGWAPYAASKAALINFGVTAAEELAPLGIRVYTVAPGRCATQLRRQLAPDEDQSTIMQPAEVATAVAQLVHDVDGVLAGQVIEVKRRTP